MEVSLKAKGYVRPHPIYWDGDIDGGKVVSGRHNPGMASAHGIPEASGSPSEALEAVPVAKVGSICPFCHFSPIFPGQGPFDGNTVPFNGLDNGPGLFTALRNFFFGDPEVPRKNRVRSNETTEDIVLFPPDNHRKVCAKCKCPNWCSASKCEKRKRKFVEKYL